MILGLAGRLDAQDVVTAVEPPAPLARFVPESAGVFVSFRTLADADRAVEETGARAMFDLLPSVRGGAMDPRTVTQWVRELLGPRCPVRVEDLADLEIAAAADSWATLDEAVWYIRLKDPAVVDQWFPKARRTPEHDLSDVHFFMTPENVIVSIRQGVMAVGRQATAGSLLGESLDLMADIEGVPLSESPLYARLSAGLPPGAVATVFSRSSAMREAWGPVGAALASTTDAALVTVHAGAKRLDLVVRAAGTMGGGAVPLSPGVLEQVQQLPHSTVALWAYATDAQAAFDRAVAGRSNPWISSHLALLSGYLASPQRREAGLLRGVGPGVVLAWGGSLTAPGMLPPVAVLVECDDARGLADELEHNLRRLLEPPAAKDGAAPAPSLDVSTLLGARIVQVPLRPLAERLRISLPEAAACTPTFAASGRWLILSTSPEHVREIVSARNGNLPTLGKLGDVRRLCGHEVRNGSLWVIQPRIAAQTMARWLAESSAGGPSFLNARRWRPARGEAGGAVRRYGIGMRAEQAPGVVQVAVVHEGGAAAGRLLPGDRIVGVDGQLLDMTAPNADLRARLRDRAPGAGPVLRVLRDGAVIDVALAAPPERTVAQDEPIDVPGAVRELAAILRPMRMVTCGVEPSGPGLLSARLSVRFDRPTAKLAERPDGQ